MSDTSAETGDSPPMALIWERTEEEFEKIDRQITPEVVRDRERLISLFVVLIERCREIARTMAPEQDDMLFYNGIFAEFMYTHGETREDHELILRAAWDAEFVE